MKQKSLANNIVILISLTILLKCVGFINRIVIAYYFGTSSLTDIYYNASGFVDGISAVILASLSVGIINIYINNKNKRDNNKFISNLVVVIVLFMVFLALLLFFSSGVIAKMLAPAYGSKDTMYLKNILKWMCMVLPFQGCIAVYSAVLEAEKRFTPVRLTGTATSVINIMCILLLAKRIHTATLLVSYIIGIVFNAIFLVVNAGKLCRFRPKKVLEDKDLKKLLFLIIPILIGTAGHELNLMIDKSVASQITFGAVSALSYSCVLYLFVENVIINSIVTAVFPDMTEKIMNSDKEQLALGTQNVICFAECVLIPIVICILFVSTEITKVVYMRGSFDVNSVSLTSAALCGYVIGLPFLALRDIVTRVYYAFGDTKTPVVINLVAVGINIVLDIVLAKQLGIFGITLATSLANAFSGIVLAVFVSRHFQLFKSNKFCKRLAMISFGIIPMWLTGLLFPKISNDIFLIFLYASCFVIIQFIWVVITKVFTIEEIKKVVMRARRK